MNIALEDRREWGRSRRADVPRSALAEVVSSDTRFDPVSLLESQARSRIPELVAIRYGRMLASLFAFFRGAALIMAADLAGEMNTGLTA